MLRTPGFGVRARTDLRARTDDTNGAPSYGPFMWGKIKTLVASLVTVGLLVFAPVASAAEPDGSTYTIRGGGDLDWRPTDGGFGPSTSGELNEASGTLSDANGSARYTVTAGPGLARAALRGSVAGGSGTPRFDPSVQSDAVTELTVSGPPGPVLATLNLHVDSTFRVDACAGTCIVSLSVGGPGGFTRVNTGSGVSQNDLGLTADPVIGGYHLHGDVTTRAFGMTANT